VSDHSDNQLDSDRKISGLYRTGSTAQPPAHIDQAIRAKAQQSAKLTPQRTRSRWAVPVSMAAILVLSVSLISLIHKEAPTVSDINDDITEKEIAPQSPAVTIKQKVQKSKIGLLNDQASPASINESIDMSQNDLSVEQKQQKIKPIKPSSSSRNNLASTKTEEELTADVPMETNNEMPQQSFQRIIPQPESQSSTHELSEIAAASAEPSTELKRDRHSENNKNCALLSQNACLDSEECSLILDEQKQFVCKRSMNHCDVGFIQRSDTKESCETKQECVYVSEPCFCPPDIFCVCSGDQLPQCRPQEAN